MMMQVTVMVTMERQLQLALFLIFLMMLKFTNGQELALVNRNYTDYKNPLRNLQENLVLLNSDSLER